MNGCSPSELRVYRVAVDLLSMKLEPDEDIHLVVSQPEQPRETMIVEFPSESCTLGARPARRRQVRRARAALERTCGLPLSSRFQQLQGKGGSRASTSSLAVAALIATP